MSFKKRKVQFLPALKSQVHGVSLDSLYENWYLDGGRASHEIVTQWYDFPDAEI